MSELCEGLRGKERKQKEEEEKKRNIYFRALTMNVKGTIGSSPTWLNKTTRCANSSVIRVRLK